MIGVSSSSRSFKVLGRYLVIGRSEEPEGRVAWSTARNLPTDDPELAAKIMRATASQNVRTGQPVYHLALSFDPHDAVNRATMERVADRVIAELRLQEHQVLIVAHADRLHPHMHILVNRVHPETGKMWDRWQDYGAIQQVLREEERALGLRAVRGSHDRTQQAADLDGPRDAVEATRRAARSNGHGRQHGEPEYLAAIRADLDAHERAATLSRQRYATEMDVAAQQARATHLQSSIHRAERADASFIQALGTVYRDPGAARSSFLAAAAEIGLPDAVRRLGETPERFGDPRLTPSAESLARAAQVAATRGGELLNARQELGKLLEAELGSVVAGKVVNPLQVDAMKVIGEERLRHALEHARFLRKEGQSLGTLGDIEFRLSRGLRRLSPHEFSHLCMTLSGNRLSVARKLRDAARDVVLGREESR
jgi:hypothetical protein